MKTKAAPSTVQVVSQTHTHIFPAGCHPAIQEELCLAAGRPVSIPAAALTFALSFPGIEAPAAADATPIDSPAPQAPTSEED